MSESTRMAESGNRSLGHGSSPADLVVARLTLTVEQLAAYDGT